ncbi:hypothetical protein [Antarctobacter sp.]|uniref:hypothetical protein n=1 Tax=Antarctobacter sp. TaxID=1872577 RepID=UPI003A9223F7
MRRWRLALALAGVVSGTPVLPAPVAQVCSCDPAPEGVHGTVPSATGPASCLLVSKLDGQGCRILVDAPHGSADHDAMVLALFPRLGGLRSEGAMPSVRDYSWVLDVASPGAAAAPRAAERRLARREGLADLLAQRTSALLHDAGDAVPGAFRSGVMTAAPAVEVCRARTLHDFLGGGPLILDLPPYTVELEQGFGCYKAQFGGYLSFAVVVEDRLYRYMMSMRWPPRP